MRAVMVDRFGPPGVLRPVDRPDPGAGSGQLTVDVAFASITFVETQIRAGRPPHPTMLPTLPAILGNGVGGVVASVGDGVDPGLVGARVVTTTGGTGGYADRVAVAAETVHLVPDELPLDAAVALLADGRTAMGLIEAASLTTGGSEDSAADQTVLVEAAGGGVGSLLVQLASSTGARVVAVAGGADKLALAHSLGASVGIDYRDTDWAEDVRRRVGAVDVVFDGVGGQTGVDAFSLVRPGGRFVAYGMASGAFSELRSEEQSTVRQTGLGALSPDDIVRLTRSALDTAAAGRMHPVIGQRVPLDRAADAHAAIEARSTLGKTLLTMTPHTTPHTIPHATISGIAARSGAVLRAETASDVDAIRAVTVAAFPSEHEATIIDELRDSEAWIPGLSWVAVLDGDVVAHALLTRCHVDDTPSLTLGPIAVAPEHQGTGLGTAVTAAAIDTARSRGEPSVIVLGHPEYYPRFGFTTASAHGIRVDADIPEEALMAMSLDGSPLPSGTVQYPAAFGM